MSQALTLYEAEQHLAALADTAAVVTEEQLGEFASDLARATEYGLAKRDNCARFILHLEEQIAFSKKERARLATREKSLEAGLAKFAAYLLAIIEVHGKRTSPTITRLEGRVGDLCAVDGGGSVEITNEAEVPMKYKRVVVKMYARDWLELVRLASTDEDPVDEWPDVEVTYSTSASAVKAAIKAGETVPGATLKYSTGLQIK